MWGVIIHSEGETVVVISRVTEYSASSKHTDVERVHQCELVWPNYLQNPNETNIEHAVRVAIGG